jgi:hypothetical protein
MNTRPRDICTAAFHDDVERLRQLVVVAGVYTGRWQPPCRVDTSPAARASLEAPLGWDDGMEGDGGVQRRTSATPAERNPIISEDAADEMTEVISEEEMAALMAHPDLQWVTQAYALESTNVDDNAAAAAAVDENNNALQGGEGDDAELLDEAEEEAAEADRQAQQHDLLIYRCLLAEQRHRESVAQRLQQHGLLHTSVTPPVNMTTYGILFSCREKAVCAAFPGSLSSAPSLGKENTLAAHPSDTTTTTTSLQVRWQPSKRSRYAGTPLHWAVLARAHSTVKFLVEHGADETAGLRSTDDGLPEARAEEEEEDNDGSSTAATAAAAKVLAQLTPAAMAEANESLPTLRVLEAALAARTAEEENRRLFYVALKNRMERRKQRYVQRRQIAMARRALQVQAQFEAEERERAANEQAAAADAEGGEGEPEEVADEELDDGDE